MSHEQKIEIRRLLIFGVVGSLNTLICYALFATLVHWFEWHYNLALVADYVFGSVVGYLLHRLSTFADRTHLRQAFGKYAVTLVLAFLANLVALDAIVVQNLLGPLAAQIVAMTVATFVSYSLQKHWVFRSHEQLECPPAQPQSQLAA